MDFGSLSGTTVAVLPHEADTDDPPRDWKVEYHYFCYFDSVVSRCIVGDNSVDAAVAVDVDVDPIPWKERIVDIVVAAVVVKYRVVAVVVAFVMICHWIHDGYDAEDYHN
jgi:hypothetical protein